MGGVFITGALIGTRDLINWLCRQGQHRLKTIFKGIISGQTSNKNYHLR